MFVLFESKTIPSEKATRPVTISIDGNNPVTYRALSGNSVLSVLLIRDLEEALRSAKTLRATIDGQEHAFHVEHAGEALDAVSRCAGMPDHAERLAHAPSAIQGAGNWTMVDKAAAMNGCIVRVNGAEVDTTMTFNNKGQVLLIAGHPEWAAWPGEANIQLRIDAAPPDPMKASAINNIVLVSIANEDMLSRLRRAKTLSWALPTGMFQSDVTGLGVALDALAACNKAKRTGH